MAKCRELLNKGLLQDIFREQMWALSEVREKVYNFQKLPLDKSHFITETGAMGLNDRMDFMDMFQKQISDMKLLSQKKAAAYYQYSMQAYWDFMNKK